MATEITVLVDNEPSVGKLQLHTERGHSLLVRWGHRSVLLDTGISGLFADNAHMLGIRVADIDTVVLSHGHFDHTGGLRRLLAENDRANVYAAVGIRQRLWLSLLGFTKDVGIDPKLLESASSRLHLITANSEPEPGLHLVVTIPAVHPRPRGNELLFSGCADERRPDDLAHELVLVLEDSDGLIVFTGCGHHGVLNIIDGIRNVLPGQSIKAVIGGFHFVGFPYFGLFSEPRNTMADVGRTLGAMQIGRIVTGHCTGREGCAVLREVLGPRVEYAATGATITV